MFPVLGHQQFKVQLYFAKTFNLVTFTTYALTKFTWFNPHIKKGLFFESECERSRAWGCVGAMACRSHKPVRRGSDEGSAEETGEQVPEIGAFLSDSHCH